MTIQLLHPYNGNRPGIYSSMGSAEEARLVGLGLARYWTDGIDGKNTQFSEAEKAAGQALVSTPGNVALLLATIGADEVPTPLIVDNYQDHSLYTLGGSTGTASTESTQNSGGSKVLIPSSGAGTTTMTCQRVSTLSFVPSKMGVMAWYANIDDQRSSHGLQFGSENVSYLDSSSAPFRAPGGAWFSANVSEFPTFAAGTTPATITPRLFCGLSGSTGVTNWRPGPIYCRAAGVTSLVPTFDDIYEETYTVAFPIMRALGLVGTVFVVSANVGTTGKMTWGMLQTLRDAGWAICASATPDDTDAEIADATAAVNELEVVRQAIIDNGCSVNGSENYGCWPNDARSNLLYTAFKAAGMKAMRSTTGANIYDRFGLADQAMCLPSYSWQATRTLEQIQTQTALAIGRGASQITHVHGVKASGATGSNMNVDVFEPAMEYYAGLVSAGTVVNETFPQWYRRVSINVPPVIA